MVCSVGDMKDRVRAETLAGWPEGTERVAGVRRVLVSNGRSRGIDGGSDGERSGQGRRKVFQFLFGFLNVVMTNGSPLECTKSIELHSTISKTRKIRCGVHGVNAQYFL